MTRKNILFAVVVVAAAGLTLLSQTVLAAERISPDEDTKATKDTDKKTAIAIDVVLEEVDLSTNTITARTTDLCRSSPRQSWRSSVHDGDDRC